MLVEAAGRQPTGLHRSTSRDAEQSIDEQKRSGSTCPTHPAEVGCSATRGVRGARPAASGRAAGVGAVLAAFLLGSWAGAWLGRGRERVGARRTWDRDGFLNCASRENSRTWSILSSPRFMTSTSGLISSSRPKTWQICARPPARHAIARHVIALSARGVGTKDRISMRGHAPAEGSLRRWGGARGGRGRSGSLEPLERFRT